MKKTIFNILLLAILLPYLFSSCGESNQQKALNFNNEIVEEKGKIINKMVDLVNTFEKANFDEMTASLAKLNQQTASSIENVKKLSSFSSESAAFQKAAIDLFSFYHKLTTKEYKEMIIVLAKIKNETASETEITFLANLENTITAEEKPLDDNFQNTQKAFANKYKLDLSDIKRKN